MEAQAETAAKKEWPTLAADDLNRVMRRPEVCQRLGGIKPTFLYELIKRGEFPPGILIGKKLVAWPVSDVVAFLDRQKLARDAGAKSSAQPWPQGRKRGPRP